MKRYRKAHKQKDYSAYKRKQQFNTFWQKYGMIIFAIIMGLILGKYVLPRFF